MLFVLFGCIFGMNALDPPRRTLTGCFGAFRTIWLHSGPFGCLTKHGAKRAELVQKFVPRSRVGICRNERIRSSPLDPKLTFGVFRTVWVQFRKERTRSTQLDPKLTFWCVSNYLGAFGTFCLRYETRCKTGRTSAKVCATQLHWIFLNEST